MAIVEQIIERDAAGRMTRTLPAEEEAAIMVFGSLDRFSRRPEYQTTGEASYEAFVTGGLANLDLARIVELVTAKGKDSPELRQRSGPATAPRQEVNVVRPEVHARFRGVVVRGIARADREIAEGLAKLKPRPWTTPRARRRTHPAVATRAGSAREADERPICAAGYG
jgi:hypothetical protein